MDRKTDSYYAQVREDLLPLIPKGATRLLDVGCGTGETGLAAKHRLATHEVIGIEFFESVALIAQTKLDQVIVGDIETLDLNFPENYFDCILCADILEHTKDPWQVLRRLRRFLRRDGTVVASIPNVRHIVPLLKIIFDRFEYDESGILDKTHLRFFTLHTIRQMFHESGYSIQQVKTNRNSTWKHILMHILSLGLLRQFSIFQYLVVATKSDPERG